MTLNGGSKRTGGDSALPVYPIRTVSKITGIGESTLRAWEVRYGIIRPARTKGGHRLFSEKDIGQIMEIKRLLYKEGLSLAGVQMILSSAKEARHG